MMEYRVQQKYEEKRSFSCYPLFQYSSTPSFRFLLPSFRNKGAGHRSGATCLGDGVGNIFGPLATPCKEDPVHPRYNWVETWSLCIKSVRRFLQFEDVFQKIILLSGDEPRGQDDQIRFQFKRLSQKGILSPDHQFPVSSIDLGWISPSVDDSLFLDPLVEFFKSFSKGSHIHIEYGYIGIRNLIPEEMGLLSRIHAADP